MSALGSKRVLTMLGIGVAVIVAVGAVVASLVLGTGFSLTGAAPSPPASATPTGSAAATTTNAETETPEPETVTVTVTVPVDSASTTGILDPTGSPSTAGIRPAAPLRAPRTATLFDGAYFSPYAAKKPSLGGVRLATLPEVPKRALTGTFIVLDPGHSGATDATIFKRQVPAGGGRTKECNTTGAQTSAGYAEHAHNWDVVLNLAALLRERGATVILTRPNDTGIGPCVDERAAIGNRANADLVVSVHADGNTARTARGFHVITARSMTGGPAVASKSLAMAAKIRDAFGAGTGMPRSTYTGEGQGITRRADLAGLNLSNVPAVMLEAGNLRHTGDAALLSNHAYRLREAHALAAGIQAALDR